MKSQSALSPVLVLFVLAKFLKTRVLAERVEHRVEFEALDGQRRAGGHRQQLAR
jgi:hypothetical protein